MKNIGIERSVSIQTAIKKAEECFEYLKLKYEISQLDSINKMLSTYSVKIDNTNIQGNGKGIGEQSKASALFETLEHYIYYNSVRCDEYMKVENFKTIVKEIEMEYPISYILEKCDSKETIEVSKFENLKRNKAIYYPTALWNVFNNSFEKKYEELKKYSTNSGCAIGISKIEAILHAINELIERDALSWHYIDVFINQNKKAKRIVIDSLPENLKEIYWEVRNSIKEEVFIIKIDTMQGLYGYLVYAENKKTGVPYKGSGLSSLSEYALERALLECLQSFHLCCKETEIEDKIAVQNLKMYSKYSKILMLDYENNFIDEIFEKNIVHFNSVEQLLNYENNILCKNNLEIYSKTLFSLNEVFCVQVIIPRIEKFYLVGNGLPVIPMSGRKQI